MTLLATEKVHIVMEDHAKNPGARYAQRQLALEVTALAHGSQIANSVERASELMFGNTTFEEYSKHDLEILFANAPAFKTTSGESLVDILIRFDLASSKREARQFLEDGAVMLNGKVVKEDMALHEDNYIDRVVLLKRGKRNVVVLKLA